MRPGVIRKNREVVSQVVLNGEQQRVVICGGAVIQVVDHAKVLPLIGIQKIQQPAIVRVGRGGAGRIGNARDHATRLGQVDSRIDGIVGPQVNRIVAQVITREQPAPDLFLDAEIPLL